MENKLNVGIIIGGKSVEHDISILSGLQVYHACDKSKYNVTIFYLTKDLKWLIGDDLTLLNTYKNESFNKCQRVYFYSDNNKVYYKLINKKKKPNVIDVFIPVVHGEGVEDGTLSAFLDLLNAPYTSSSLTSSSICQDKIYTKQILLNEGIPTLPFVKLSSTDSFYDILNDVKNLGFPVIIKPARLGSSIGITTSNNEESLRKSIEEGKKFGSRLLIEKKLDNFKEYNIAICKNSNKLCFSCIEEVKKSDEILSFVDKYERLNKLDDSSRIIPAIISKELEKKIKEICKKAYLVLEMTGVVRMDFLYDVETSEIYLNEINTIPGSFAFYLFEKANISFSKLIDTLIKQALLNKRENDSYLKVFTSNVLSKKSSKLMK